MSEFITMMRLTACLAVVAASSYCAAYELPSGKILEIRLTRSLASFSARKGNDVEGVIIAPVFDSGRIVIPMGSRVNGAVQSVTRVGLGLIHETARLAIAFDKLTLPDGTVLALATQVTEIDNAREIVDKRGRVDGIRSTGTIGYRANNAIAGVAMLDPIAYVYVNVAAARVLRFSEPEIWFPAGTELAVKLLTPLSLSRTYPSPVPPLETSAAQRTELESLLRTLPYRTAMINTNTKSDLTNLVFLGTPAAVERAFEAAGWVQTDRLNTITGFLTVRSIAENQSYSSAPMSMLLLDEQRPYFEFSKSLNTFAKRHHTRIWLRSENWQGAPVLTASSTQDVGIQLSRRKKTFIHVIDTDIDNERAKIVNDLIFTGCVDAAELFPRPWVPPGASNATGEALHTDRRVAVLQMNDCLHPHDPVDLQAPPDQPATGNTVERGFRQGFLITRNDLYRGNLIYQGYEGTRLGIKYLKRKDQSAAGSSVTGDQGDVIAVAPNDPDLTIEPSTERAPLKAGGPLPPAPENPVYVSPEEKAPFIELGVEGGWLRFGNTLDITNIGLRSNTPDVPSFTLLLQNQLHNGFAVGTSVTLNSWKYVSNEFSFDYQRGKYRLGAQFSGFNGVEPVGYQEETTGLLTNQFGYATLINLRSRDKRLRPYIAVGLAFQLLHITDAPFKSSAGIFKVGLRNVGLILAAYNFANNPPLDGGGVFQFGFQYGGGVKYRVSRRWMARIDYRETLSPQPNFIERSIEIDNPADSSEYTVYYEANKPAGPLREQRLTGGIAFTF
jgi:opacity protein-like surface antigen